jgi:tetratricopeptide (TPR) repeat protein
MEKLLMLFLSGLSMLPYGCGSSLPVRALPDCTDKRIQDSLLKKYIENGAYKLPHHYNDPAWPLYCDSVMAICPNIASVYQLKALPHIKYGDYEKAFALNNKAVQLDPAGYTAYRGFLKCIFTKDYEGALIDFTTAEQLIPRGIIMDHTYAFYEGLCNLELGNYPQAEQNFKKDIYRQTNGDPGKKPHYNTLLYMGILYYEMNLDTPAKEYLLNCLSVYNQLPEANYYLALIYQRQKNTALQGKYLQAAKEAYSKGYRLNEDNMYYANYPHQVTLYEIEQALEN